MVWKSNFDTVNSKSFVYLKVDSLYKMIMKYVYT